MIEYLLSHEAAIRLPVFLGLLAALGLAEALLPRRARAVARARRWPHNLVLAFTGTIAVRLIFPITVVAFADELAAARFGILHWLDVPAVIALPLSFAILDATIYFQHRLFHAVPILWRLHRVHHADVDFDVTTGARFHPVEIVASMAIKFAMVGLLGAPAIAVLAFEIVLSGLALFNHANIGIPLGIDGIMRQLIVTPDMHRVHHSIVMRETNSNFGFNISLWDRLFRTYRAQPEAGHLDMTIGLEIFRAAGEQRIDHLLTQPFRTPQVGRPMS